MKIKDVDENFADGKQPGRKGLAKRMGVDCKQSVSALRKIAANSSGERQRMAHWCANMKSGRNESVIEGTFRSQDVEEFKPDNDSLDNIKNRYLPSWEMLDHRFLQAQFLAQDHKQAAKMVVFINLLSEKMDHFAEVTQDFAEVTVKTSTSDVNGLTLLDFQLAMLINDYAKKNNIQLVPAGGNFVNEVKLRTDITKKATGFANKKFLNKPIEKVQGGFDQSARQKLKHHSTMQDDRRVYHGIDSDGHHHYMTVNHEGNVDSSVTAIKKGKSHDIDMAVAVPGAGVHKLYHHLITKHNHILTSKDQSYGGLGIWQKMRKMGGVNIHGYHSKSGKGQAIDIVKHPEDSHVSDKELEKFLKTKGMSVAKRKAEYADLKKQQKMHIVAHKNRNIRPARSVNEGGWASAATQNTKITPAVLDEAVATLQQFEVNFNQWQAKQGLDVEIKIGRPVGSGTYYKRDLAQDPEREYGDVDVMCYIHSKEGVGAAQRITEYKMAITEYCLQAAAYSTENGTNIIMDTSAGPVQVDLIYTYHEHANWARMLAPEYRVKGVVNTSLVSSVAEVLNLSIGTQGVQVKTRDGRPVSFRQSRDTVLGTVSIDPENWGSDIYSYYYSLAQGKQPDKIPANLGKHSGLKDEQRISDIVLTIKALAMDLEKSNLLGQGALDHVSSADDLVRQVARVFGSKMDKVIDSSKFDKAATPAAVEKANKTKIMLAKYKNEISKLLIG